MKNHHFFKFVVLAIFSISIIFFSGCSSSTSNVGMDDGSIGEGDLQSSESSVELNNSDIGAGFATATPPPFPDLRGQTFDIYFIGGVSDTYIDLTKSIELGLEDGFAFLNAHGGVYGAQIELHFIGVLDYEEELEQAYKDLVDLDPFLILLAVPVSQEFYELLNEEEIPVLFYGIGTPRLDVLEVDEDYLFWLTPFPDEQMVFIFNEIWMNWKDVRPPGNFNEMDIGYLSWEGDDFKNISLSPESQAYLQRHNYALVVEEWLPVSVNSSATNFLLESVHEGVTVIYTDTYTFGPAVLMNDLNSLGLSDFFVVAGNQWMLGGHVDQYLRFEERIGSLYMPLSIAWWSETENPAIVKAEQILAASGRTEAKQDFGYLLSLGVVDIIDNLLNMSVEEIESSAVKAEDIMENLSDFDYEVMDGLFSVDYRFGNRSVDQIRLWQYAMQEELMDSIGELSTVPDLQLIEE